MSGSASTPTGVTWPARRMPTMVGGVSTDLLRLEENT